VTADDAERLAVGFESLSPESRLRRFLAPVSHLTPDQLRYFTDVDQADHVAWGAMDARRPDGPGLGVGRWVRLREDPAVAEFSLTVVDDAQGRGLGVLLLAVLHVLAEGLGVRVLRGLVARSNQPMVEWLTRLGAEPTPGEESDEGVVMLELPVPQNAPDNASARRLAERIGQVRSAVGVAPPAEGRGRRGKGRSRQRR
jgi:GNAT superfamily N-acetyltransferase